MAFVHQTEKEDPDEQWYCEFVERRETTATDAPSTTEREGHDLLAELEENETGDDLGETEKSIGAEQVDEGEIVAGEMTSRGEGSEDGIDASEGEMRTEDDVVPEASEGRDEADELLESEVETANTTEREPLEESDPMGTSTDEQGVDAEVGEPVGSGAEPAEPGEPTPDQEIPTEREPPESEPAEPAETDIGGEPIESDVETGEPAEGEPTDATSAGAASAGAAGAGAAAIDLTAEDKGKDVVDESGEQLGTVADVKGDTIRVDPDAGMTDDQRSEFGWDDRERDTHRVENDRIREVTVTEVVIFRL